MLFFDNIFIQMALWACLLASFASGVIGSFVVIKRISFIAGSIAHSVLGGMGLCLWLQRSYGLSWLDPIYGAFATAIASALLLGWIHLHYKQREDAVIAAIWSTGMAIGMIFLSITPGTNVELLNYLFGNILWIQTADLIRLAVLNVIILGIVAFYYRKFLAICFDEEQALLQGVPAKGLYLLLLSLVAVSIVLLMQIIGTILVIALLTIPATLASLFTSRLIIMMGAATGFCALFSLVGMGIAHTLNWPPSATIALVAAASYLLLLPQKKKKNFLRKAPN
ncbi:MAG: metal ABC transporter permease [Chlamydiae bacterium CG10_big_fil_rev_8_21_14_0_10_42_34]|nr:MAG: metal ABC transporter permease [Chlamydiae bacterium CG10_big_fil_rev_8_21_14_0_10_42_34]